MTILQRTLVLPAAFLILNALPRTAVHAQTEASVIREVVVTARRREESLQETPVSVVAMGGADLEQQNVDSLDQLNIKLPNVGLGSSGGLGGNNGSFYIRGLGTGRNSLNQESAVALYIDDAYFGRSDAALLQILDVERIEVLRGPQGTLFGRNATSGAIRYITRKPTIGETSGKVSLTAGEYDRFDVKGAVNLPTGDNAALRLTAATLNRGGFIKNEVTGEDLGDIGYNALRGQFLWLPTDAFEVLAAVDYSENDTNGPGSTALSYDNSAPFQAAAPGIAENDFVNTIIPGTEGTEDVPTDDFFATYGTGPQHNKTDSLGLSLTLDWALNDSMSLTSATTYRDLSADVGIDIDGSPAALLERTALREITTMTQEIQLSGVGETVDWISGVFFLNEDGSSSQEEFRGTHFAPVAPYGIAGSQFVSPHETTSFAVFGQMTFHLTDRVSLTGGLRWTRDDKRLDVRMTTPDESSTATITPEDPGFPPYQADTQFEDDWSAVSGRASIEWQVRDNFFTYASYSRGFRSGGINDEFDEAGGIDNFGITSFDEETLDSFEIGMRSDLLDDRLRLNVTAFHSIANDLQFTKLVDPTGASSASIIDNAAKATIQGLEGDFIVIINEYLSVDGRYGLLNFEYDELEPGVTAITLDSDGARAPDFSYSLGTNITAPLANGELDLRLDYGWKDDHRLLEGDAVAIRQKSYGLFDVNLTYRSEAGWSVSAFATNLGGEEYATGGLDIAGLGFVQVEPGRPQEWGVRFSYEF